MSKKNKEKSDNHEKKTVMHYDKLKNDHSKATYTEYENILSCCSSEMKRSIALYDEGTDDLIHPNVYEKVKTDSNAFSKKKDHVSDEEAEEIFRFLEENRSESPSPELEFLSPVKKRRKLC